MEKIISNNSVELYNKVKETINNIENLDSERYEIKGDTNKLKSLNMMKVITDLGICDRRRLKRRLNKVINKESLKSINSLLRFLSQKLGIDIVKVREPKHEEIQKLRKEWKKLQEQADAALSAYKNYKGDYYKSQMEQKKAA